MLRRVRRWLEDSLLVHPPVPASGHRMLLLAAWACSALTTISVAQLATPTPEQLEWQDYEMGA